MSKRRTNSVLTGDIVNSTQIPDHKAEGLLKALKKALKPYSNSFYRGDSFQVLVPTPQESLRVALLCRTLAISLSEAGGVRSDIRISIGIGNVRLPVKMPDQAQGDAFVFSGRGLDRIEETGQRLTISGGDLPADTGSQVASITFEIMANYLDSIFEKMTSKQAAAILDLLRRKQQQDVAIKLKRAKSTISQLVNAGRWPEIESLLQQFETLINLLL